MDGGDGGRLRGDIGRLLRLRRRAAGMSQDRLAGASQLAQSVVSRVERGLYPASLDLIERLFGALDLQLRVQATTAHAELDKEISELARQPIAERIAGTWAVQALWSLRRWGPVPVVIEGALAAVLQGAPIPVDDVDIAVSRHDSDAFTRWLDWTAAMAWDEERQDYTYDRPDLRRRDNVRWHTPYGVVRTRIVDSFPASIEVIHEDETYRVRPLIEVEVVDPHAAELLARWRELAAAGSAQPGEPSRPVAAVTDEFDDA